MNKRIYAFLLIQSIVAVSGCSSSKEGDSSYSLSIDKTGYIPIKEAYFGKNVDKSALSSFFDGDSETKKVYKEELSIYNTEDAGYFSIFTNDSFYYHYTRERYVSSGGFSNSIKFFPDRGAVIVFSQTIHQEKSTIGSVEMITEERISATVAFTIGVTAEKSAFTGEYARGGTNSYNYSANSYTVSATYQIPYLISPDAVCDASFSHCDWTFSSTMNASDEKNALDNFKKDSGKLLYKVYEQIDGALSLFNNKLIACNSNYKLISR